MNNLFWNVIEESASVAALEFLKVSDIIKTENEYLNYIKMGIMWTLATEVIRYLKTNNAYLTNGAYYLFCDEAFFNSVLYTAIEKSGIGEKVMNTADILPLPPTVNGAIATGVCKVSAKVLAEYLDENMAQSPARYLTHITRYIISA